MTRVLIVDDKEENLYYLRALLTGHGFEVEEARHGAEALVKARQKAPDLIVSDLLMPVMDGYTLLRHWKADPRLKRVPFIVYTATYTEAEDERLALGLGADAFILKPAEPDDFLARIRQVQSNGVAAVPTLPRHTPDDEKELLKVYSETLIRKLEEKMLLLEESNKALEKDIAERTRAQQQVADAQRFNQTLIENSPLAIITYKATGEAVTANSASVRMLGAADLATLQSQNFRHIDAWRRTGLLAAADEALSTGQPRELEVRTATSFGKEVWLHGRLIPIGYADESYLLCFFEDIRDRKLAEDQLQEKATLLDKAQDAILVRDLENRILYWNKSAERLYGWTAAEAAGRRVQDLIYNDTTFFNVAVESTITDGEWVGEIEQRTKTGQAITVEGRWTLVRDNEGRPKSILAINTDITQRKDLEQQFLRAQRIESIGTLAGGIAHDLNNVLAPIIMSVDLLKMEEKDGRRLELLTSIETSANRGASMVSQVLSFARGMEGRRVDVQPKHLIRDIIKITSDTFPKAIRVDSRIDPKLWSLKADPTQLHQVLLNLCVNARDAMPDGGQISISAENMMIDGHYAAMNIGAKVGPYIWIEVRDTGSGIPREIIEKIFDPFFTTKEVGRGTGLGLSTVMAIVKSHGGFIHVNSDPGTGARFRVYLPAQPDGTVAEPSASAVEIPRGNGETVLIVDDEPSIRQIIKQTLEAFGYKVLLAADGSEAVSIYARHQAEVAVVITDMMMPVMDGPATIQILLRLNPKLKIIGASGISTNGKITQASGLGVKHFLPKPFTAETLLKALKEVISERESDRPVQ
ncbi:MAG TPA: response regulator [Roseimicrobium sp.]|nr:response regulator [Roseimicrobium sp.]